MSKEVLKIIVVLGTTASGKTALGVRLARELGGEIISADSRQVYRGMDLGSGKDLEEYGDVPYHLIDVVSPRGDFNLAKWLLGARKEIGEICGRGKTPIVVGGTALYLNALIRGYELGPGGVDSKLRKRLNAQTLGELTAELERLAPDVARKTDLKNPRRVARALEKILLAGSSCGRGGTGMDKMAEAIGVGGKAPKYEFLVLGLTYPRPNLRERITQRLRERLERGMVAEVQNLHKQGVSWQKLDDFGLEYRFISRYLRGQLTETEMEKKITIASSQFAKRQMTWFKKMPAVRWVEAYSEAKRLAREFLK